MRILLDLQSCQAAGSRFRGIGRYSLSLAKAMIRNAGNHEISILLNDRFQDSITFLRKEFKGLVPKENIYVFSIPGDIAECDQSNINRTKVAELIREYAVQNIKPDILHITNFLEVFNDDVAISIKRINSNIAIAVTLYDLIPLIYQSRYLKNDIRKKWYMRKIADLKKADLLLAISESSMNEGKTFLGIEKEIINISGAVDNCFIKKQVDIDDETSLRARYNLSGQFLLYTGGIDYRKNIEGLITAYSRLPLALRREHQLVIVCSIYPEARANFDELIHQNGLSKHEVIFTGFVPEHDLVMLYNICRAFVFPSWHEGFGLPLLEAMCCGAPVIGSNTSSVPEVIGLQEALFDPYDIVDMTNRMQQVLSDGEFRKRLINHAEDQSKKFSWDESARRALKAFESILEKKQKGNQVLKALQRKLKLAFVSPLSPAKSGIADYSAELLQYLSAYYDIELIAAQSSVSLFISNTYQIRGIEWFIDNYDKYDRVLYHFGNSEFHMHMFNLIRIIPGVVVLHDFYLSGVVIHMEFKGYKYGFLNKMLYEAHGWKGIIDRYMNCDIQEIVWKYPCNIHIIENSLGIIIHSEYSRELASKWLDKDVAGQWKIIPHLREPVDHFDKASAKKALGFVDSDFMVCSFGFLNYTKANKKLINAWLGSKLSRISACHLVFVGQKPDNNYGDEIETLISRSGISNIRITGWADMPEYKQYLAAADMAVQLRTSSRGETSGTVLDCMNYGLPLIVNANGSMAELPVDAVLMIKDDFTEHELITALEALYDDRILRTTLSKRAAAHIANKHDPFLCAELYAKNIEHFYSNSNHVKTLANDIIKSGYKFKKTDLMLFSQVIAANQKRIGQRQIFIDISELVQRDSKSGIQRVVKKILRYLLENPPAGYRIEPVYAHADTDGYYYAKKFINRFFNLPKLGFEDELIDAYPGDFFLALDLQPVVLPSQVNFLQMLRNKGIPVFAMVYDLIAVLHPEFFINGARDLFTNWLDSVTGLDGAICISQSVAAELKEWIRECKPEIQDSFCIEWFHLGADFMDALSLNKKNFKRRLKLPDFNNKPVFLMVGTLEPRKGHDHILDAFNILWGRGLEFNLVIVGKKGWLAEELVKKIKNHPELNKRLFWLEGITDEYLEAVYAASTCLIAASEAEGFGLPLIEAAQHKLPIIARDIPVFREVAGEHSYYFRNSSNPEIIADAIIEWLKLYEQGNHIRSDNMPWLTWKESAGALMEKITGS